jgi:drug/metabolite transporter (DMT)-like permease
MNFLLYVSTILIWGSTWLAIKFQIGDVDPMVSVCYRFGLAAVILLVYCRLAGLRMRFRLVEHLFMGLQGLFLFSVSYWLVYKAEVHLTSGLVAVLYSNLIFLNSINGFVFMKSPVRRSVIAGGVIGILGIGLLFWPEIAALELAGREVQALLMGIASVVLASLGNILSARNQRSDLPIIQTNAFGMAYGTLILAGVSIFMEKPFSFTFSPGYIGSLIYLSVFGSIAAFGAYLTLVGRMGADRAAYVTLLIPVVALVISTLFEGYQWTLQAFFGLSLILFGNFMIVHKKIQRMAFGPAAGREGRMEPE